MTDRTPANIAAPPPSPLTRLHESRLARWHQTGEALLTFENVRSWLNAAGLVLFAPLPQIPAPTPTLVEAVLGGPAPNPTLQQTQEARMLLARLVAEGIAVPLNLLGSASGAVGETPDYIASAAVFSYIFTLRGDKAWKQPPSASGVAKVSQLAAHAYEILAKSGPRTVSDLTTELGNAVTESAVLRGLGELWTHLRVLPVTQQEGRATVWELASARFTKQIKAGANAGQPSALSALISLYLGQVAVATEDEIEVFLSPLAPRSRTRDVLHALTAARQLESIAIEGRTMLHLAGEIPAFLNEEQAPRETIAATPLGADSSDAEQAASGEEGAETGERIKKFVPKPRKIGTGPLAKGAPVKRASRPFAKTAARSFGPKRGERPAFSSSDRGDRGSGRPERERRPFQKPRTDTAPADAKPRFDRPWSEDRPKRAPREDRPSFAASAGEETRRPAPRARTDRPDSHDRPARPARADRANGGWKPAFRSNDRAGREDRGTAPRGRAPESGDRPARFTRGPAKFGTGSEAPKRPFRRPEQGAAGGERPAPSFRKFDAPRAGAKRPFVKRGEQDGAERKPFRPRTEAGSGARGPDRGPDRGAARSFAARPSKFAAKRTGPPRGEGAAGPRREGFSPKPRGEGFSPRPPREGFSGKSRSEGFSGKPRREGFSPKPRAEGFSARAGRPGAGAARPFVKKGSSGRPPARGTFKRKEDEQA